MTTSSTAAKRQLLTAIYPILLQKGLKSTTMDTVAHTLGISKRTLYEIFESKTDMIKEVMGHHSEIQQRKIKAIIDNSPNIMVALLDIFYLHRQEMELINVNFFKDMDRLYPELRDNYEERHEHHRKFLLTLFEKGVKQGVVRNDINLLIMTRMMEIQGESLKRMEELFPPEITLVEIFDTMTIGFLRSLASRKGNDLLDSYLAEKGSLALAVRPDLPSDVKPE